MGGCAVQQVGPGMGFQFCFFELADTDAVIELCQMCTC